MGRKLEITDFLFYVFVFVFKLCETIYTHARRIPIHVHPITSPPPQRISGSMRRIPEAWVIVETYNAAAHRLARRARQGASSSRARVLCRTPHYSFYYYMTFIQKRARRCSSNERLGRVAHRRRTRQVYKKNILTITSVIINIIV